MFARARRRRKPENPVVKRRAKRAPPQNLLRRPSIEPYKIQTDLHHQQIEAGTRPFDSQLLTEEIKLHRGYLSSDPRTMGHASGTDGRPSTSSPSRRQWVSTIRQGKPGTGVTASEAVFRLEGIEGYAIGESILPLPQSCQYTISQSSNHAPKKYGDSMGKALTGIAFLRVTKPLL